MILSILIALPLAGALLTGLFPNGKGAKVLAFAASLAAFLVSLGLYTGFDPADGDFQFREFHPLLPSVGIHYSLGLDGLSLWLVLLTTFLTPLVILGSFNAARRNARGFFASVLILEAAVVGTLTATDLFLFYLFWELMLIPAFFLIGVWGGPNRVRATLKFVLFTMLGSLLMLVALLYVTHEARSFDYNDLFAHSFPPDVQVWCFLAFALAFLIKVPLFPLHAWLPDAYTEAPAGGTVMLSAVMVKLGVYGLLRFCIPLFPEAAKDFAPWIMVLAVAGVVHGALMATLQTDFKRLTAYSSLSHMGLVVLGVFTFSLTGLQGGMLQMVGHGLYIAGVFLVIGFLYERRGSHAMADFGGVAKAVPLLSFAFLWMMLSAVGLPGFAGFPGEVLLLISAYQSNPALALTAISGFVLAAWYLFHLYGKVFLGPLARPENKRLPDLSWREMGVVLPLAVLSLWVGLSPNFFLRPIEKTLEMKVIQKMKPPPAMTDFAAQQRRIQEEKSKK